MVQLMVFFMCHPSWDVRRMASDATRKIITAAPQLSEDLLHEFTNLLSLVAERLCNLKTRYIFIQGLFKNLPFFIVLSLSCTCFFE